MHHDLHIGYEPAVVHALVLAAGAGTRFGGEKLLAAYRGAPLVAAALEAAFAAPVVGVTLVTGCDATSVEAAARVCAASRALSVVHAVNWASGLAASLRTGVAALPPEAAAVLVFLGDMPCIPHGIAAQLIAARAGADAAVATFAGRRGHPVLVGRTLFERIARLDGDEGAGPLLRDPAVRVHELAVHDEGVLIDVDDPATLAALDGAAN